MQKKRTPRHENRIPLDFDKAVEGLLAVDPKQPEKPTDEDYKRAQGKRKKPKKKGSKQ